MATPVEALVAWAAGCLPEPIRAAETVVSTPHSHVLSIRTDKGVYYLKQTPPDLFIESAVLELLTKNCGVTSVPKRIAEHRELRCFITPSCGDESLRSFFRGKLDPVQLRRGVECYAQIQQATAPHIQDFLDAGVPDWRLDKIPDLCKRLLDDVNFTGFLEFSEAECAQLRGRQADLVAICQELARYRMPDTLNHSDFQNNNILIDHASGRFAVIDWGEIHIGNPLMSRHYCLTSALHVYQMDKQSADYQTLERQFFDLPGNDFPSMRDLISRLYPVFHTLTWWQLVTVTGQRLPKWRDRMRMVLLSF